MAYQSAEFAHTSRATYNAVCCSMNVPMPLVLHALAHADAGGIRDLSNERSEYKAGNNYRQREIRVVYGN